jgi:ElaB/YqjD/DUF883 family membrane-anchored ribosome-binding protein
MGAEKVKINFDRVSDEKLGGVIFAEALARVHASRIKGSFESELNGVIDEAATMHNSRTHLFVRGKVSEFRKKKGEAISAGRLRIKDKKKVRLLENVSGENKGVVDAIVPIDPFRAVGIGQAVHMEAVRACKKDKTQNYNFHLHNAMVKYCHDKNVSKELIEGCVEAYWVSLKDIGAKKNKVNLDSITPPPLQPIEPIVPSPTSPLSVVKLYRLWIENHATVPCDSFFHFFGLVENSSPIDDLKNMRTVMMQEGYEFESVPGKFIIEVVKRPDTLEELIEKLADAKNNNDRAAYTAIIQKLIKATPVNADNLQKSAGKAQSFRFG